MNLMYTLARLEATAISVWLRESGLAFFSALTLHSLAMAFVVGINLALAFRLAGLIPALPLQRFCPFLTLHWIAVLVIFASGAALLLAYPAKALTNWVFYLKLGALLLGLGLTGRLGRAIRAGRNDFTAGRRARLTAWIMILTWIVTVTAGRFLAYTHTVLLASRFY